MKVLGISPSLVFSHENFFDDLGISGSGHDSAAVLLINGVIEAAIEQERLDRIKHSNKAPIEAIRFCLKKAGCILSEIDYIAISYKEETINTVLKNRHLAKTNKDDYFNVRYYIGRLFYEACGEYPEQKRIIFVSHNDSHAESAYSQSGFSDSLVFVTDGMGDDSSGVIQLRKGNNTELLYKIPIDLSLGLFYINSINYLGYYPNDEYKVMGLAPYGNSNKYKRYFNKIVTLLPDGQYQINNYYLLLFDIDKPRRKGQPFLQVHKDIAASIQKSLEDIILHILTYYQAKTGQTKLCIAGGVGHNCSANGKIIHSGIFKDVFVQPAAHDAGAVLGAALYVYNKYCGITPNASRLSHVYWGTDIGEPKDIEKTLSSWSRFISFRKSDNIEAEAAKLLASGKIIGWVQGRSEFGPRALGNRSIIADPRPEENKKIINQMVKKRESYRPFAPSVLEEHINEYFELPQCNVTYDFMNVVLKVKEEKQPLLGAITHVDNTARIQSVSRITNPKYWNLIRQFANLTGTHILLNTSFNNNCEPIVDSAEDAVVCYLTTKLHYLVIDGFIIEKKSIEIDEYSYLKVLLPSFISLHQSKSYGDDSINRNEYYIAVNYDIAYKFLISKKCFDLLILADGSLTLDELLSLANLTEDRHKIITEFIEIWENRLINLIPDL